jgi:glycosyltransferase involved in cell wall biosynthesis
VGARTVDVLHLLGTAQPEGAGIARTVAALSRGLAPAGYRIYAWFLGGGGPLEGELLQAGAVVRVVPWRGAADLIGAARFCRALRAAPRFGLVHQHAGGPAIQYGARLVTMAPVLAHLHSAVSEGRGPSPARALARTASAVIATSRYVAERARAEAGVAAEVIYPAVQHEADGSGDSQHAARDGGDVVVGAAGRLVALKGFAHLIRAVALLRSSGVPLRLEISGEGPDEPRLRALVRELGLEGAVRFLGWVPRIDAVFPHWDLFAAPSLEEGFGIAVLEAMAAGLPVVASRAGGLPELVEHGVTGWLVPPADPGALAAAIGAALADAPGRQRVGQAARLRVREQFCVARQVDAVKRLYERLIPP